jgi:hypothetical protein
MTASEPLPRAVYDELTRIAQGAGREPTYAHPDCRCGKPYQPTCKICGAKPNKPCRPVKYDGRVVIPVEMHQRAMWKGTRGDCPVHRPAPSRRISQP